VVVLRPLPGLRGAVGLGVPRGVRASSAARPAGPPAFQRRDWRAGLAAGTAGAMGWRLGLHGLEQIAAEYSPRCTSPR
jgi:hypothetical protein